MHDAARPADRDGFTTRRCRSTLVWQLIDFVVLGVPFCAIVIGAIGGHSPLALTAAVALWALGFVRQWRRMHRLRCPGCGTSLRRQTELAPARIVFVCCDCRTIWDTGFIEPDDMPGG